MTQKYVELVFFFFLANTEGERVLGMNEKDLFITLLEFSSTFLSLKNLSTLDRIVAIRRSTKVYQHTVVCPIKNKFISKGKK